MGSAGEESFFPPVPPVHVPSDAAVMQLSHESPARSGAGPSIGFHIRGWRCCVRGGVGPLFCRQLDRKHGLLCPPRQLPHGGPHSQLHGHKKKPQSGYNEGNKSGRPGRSLTRSHNRTRGDRQSVLNTVVVDTHGERGHV